MGHYASTVLSLMILRCTWDIVKCDQTAHAYQEKKAHGCGGVIRRDGVDCNHTAHTHKASKGPTHKFVMRRADSATTKGPARKQSQAGRLDVIKPPMPAPADADSTELQQQVVIDFSGYTHHMPMQLDATLDPHEDVQQKDIGNLEPAQNTSGKADVPASGLQVNLTSVSGGTLGSMTRQAKVPFLPAAIKPALLGLARSVTPSTGNAVKKQSATQADNMSITAAQAIKGHGSKDSFAVSPEAPVVPRGPAVSAAAAASAYSAAGDAAATAAAAAAATAAAAAAASNLISLSISVSFNKGDIVPGQK